MMYGWQSDRANGWLNGNAKSTERGQLHWQTRVLRVPSLCAIRTHVGRAARGVDPVVIGGGGNYSDLGEESLGVAAAFFEETHPEQWKDKMDVYKDRRRGAKSKSSDDKNNW